MKKVKILDHQGNSLYPETRTDVVLDIDRALTVDITLRLLFAQLEHDYSELPLTFDIKSDGIITFSLKVEGSSYGGSGTFQYSLDGGETWSEATSSDTSVNVSVGDKISWKGKLNTTYAGIGSFEGSTADFDLYGCIGSMMGTFEDPEVYRWLINREYCRASAMFKGTNCINAENLILFNDYTTEIFKYSKLFYGCTKLLTTPSLSSVPLTNYCFNQMFEGCTSLTKAPILPALNLKLGCYQSMFCNCSSLNYIKALFTTTPADTYTRDWIKGVAEDGIFVKNSLAYWNVVGDNGVPTTWAILSGKNEEIVKGYLLSDLEARVATLEAQLNNQN